MFQNYQQIFDKRGQLYHQAMQRFPNARNQEFENLVRLAQIQQRHLICDIPCGGNYLCKHVSDKANIVGVDSSLSFLSNQSCLTTSSNLTTVVSLPQNTGLKTAAFDRVLSLTGIHHMQDKVPFFSEVARLLDTNGKFCIADVVEQSATALFLDEVVDCYNSMGHQGEYLNKQTVFDMQNSGLQVTHTETIDFYWRFNNEQDMLLFFSLLFGLDEIVSSDFLAETQKRLKPIKREDEYLVPWQLRYICGQKQLA